MIVMLCRSFWAVSLGPLGNCREIYEHRSQTTETNHLSTTIFRFPSLIQPIFLHCRVTSIAVKELSFYHMYTKCFANHGTMCPSAHVFTSTPTAHVYTSLSLFIRALYTINSLSPDPRLVYQCHSCPIGNAARITKIHAVGSLLV